MMAAFSDVFADVTKQGTKLQTSEYLASGKYPIIDQGQDDIAGYTDREDGLFTDVPAIIFGDHTRIVKYVDTPFFLGADGVKVLKATIPDVDYRYLYYAVSAVKIPNTGYNRHFKWLKEAQIPLPDISTQRRIADTLDKVAEGIALCRKMMDELDLMVKAKFVEMFGDPMLNPNRYALKKYGELFELNAGGTPSKAKPEYWENGTISWIGSNLCQNTILYENDGKYISQEGYEHSSARLFPADTVLIALVGATIGKTALLKFETSTNQNVLGIRQIAEAGYNPLFVFYFTQFLYPKFLNIGDGGFNMASKGFVSELPMYDINIEKQNEFAEFAKLLDKSKLTIQEICDKMEMEKLALMQEYFR